MRTGFAGQPCAAAVPAYAGIAASKTIRRRARSSMREFYSVSFSLFAVFSESIDGIPPMVSGLKGLEKLHVYTPGLRRRPLDAVTSSDFRPATLPKTSDLRLRKTSDLRPATCDYLTHTKHLPAYH